MPDANIIELIIVGLFGAGGIVAWYKARTERINGVSDASEAAVKATTEAWEKLTESQRKAMESYQGRLATLTERLCQVEKDLEKEKNRSGLLSRRVRELEQKQEEWRVERASLLARIAELEACR